MEKMTKTEAVEMLKNRKVYVKGRSKEIQEKLFELGFEWIGRGKVLSYCSAPFIYINRDISLAYDSDMDEFSESKETEISAEEILDLEIVEEKPKHEFNTFDRVLVRDKKDDEWESTFFHRYNENVMYPFKCINGTRYKYCIPYDGNEHLTGTTENPENK